MSPDKIKVFLVEDDPDWVSAVSAYLGREEDLVIVGTAANRAEAVKGAEETDPDVVLMDIDLQGEGRDGIFAALEIAEKGRAKIVMLTSLSEEQVITEAFTAGAVSYVPKAHYRELPQTIRQAHRHSYPMEVLLKELSRLKREEQLQGLTPAEREVFELIGQGYTQGQIERKLFKSESTLKNQVNKMLKKLGVRSSREAVEKVRRRGLWRGGKDRE
ncbi:response regulator transcription factor [Paenibacillus aurantius]|uniref:Response regulator transcription factor n=1 Tax=Paenibacillus aurantius TaxID=2918900 RepID=A0AA96LBQ8_9BACL|nr:response regulator transcription factor [Paenibacillus aurantius]WNQ10762.1 response regulator transcription factor [Paenibacillus aurantius]